MADMHVMKIEMARGSIGRDRILSGVVGLSTHQQPPTSAHQEDLNNELLALRREQELQQEKLWRDFQEQKAELELQHRMQIESKLQFAANGVFQELQLQRIAAEQKSLEEQQRREREAAAAAALRRNNDRHECNANASPDVKQTLKSFLIQKKIEKEKGQNSTWNRNLGVVKSSSGESLPAGASAASSHPYKIPQPPSAIVKYDSDFPLRKTASEPNLLKIRLKQSVIDRKARAGPLAARRQERLMLVHQRRLQKQVALAQASNCSSNTPDSGPNSPPTLGSRGSPTSAPIQEENEDPQYNGVNRSNINDLQLFSSPSMPNISLGRPHLSNVAAAAANHFVLMQQLRAPSQSMLAHQSSIPPPYLIPQLELTEVQAQAATAHLNHMQAVAQSVAAAYNHQINEAQAAAAQTRLQKPGHRPLGRTQSAPLPLGHPMLTGTAINIGQTHYENSEAERQAYEQQLMLKQKIRQTALSRSNTREQLKEEEPGEVIDLTDKKQPPRTVITNSVITSTSQSIPHTADERVRSEYLQKQREILLRQTMQLPSGGSIEDPYTRTPLLRPLSRTLSSPLVHVGHPGLTTGIVTSGSATSLHSDTGQQQIILNNSDSLPPPVNLSMNHHRIYENGSPLNGIKTGLAFDSMMLKHACVCGDNSSHPEHSGRLQSIWARLVETNLASRCDRLRSRKATQEELQVVHTEAHAMLFGTNQINRQKIEASRASFVRLACGGVGVDLDTTWNENHTASAARMAAGCVIDLAFKTAKGDNKNGFAVVRPPGHHAESGLAMGFCFFNSIAVAARLLRLKMPEIRRVLIVDWDVHHGNGTQQIFYDDPSVLYLSIHRHDDGNFFPGTGGSTECGTGSGLGFNVNIAWSGGLTPPLGDAEYLAAFRTIVVPIAREFSPDIVLVSAGFDAAMGHPAPLGGYVVSPACFGHLTRELMQLADGKVVLALEGGYDLPAICDSVQECVRALLGDESAPISDEELSRPPCPSAIETLQKTIAIQMTHWPCVKQLAHTVGFSAVHALKSEHEETETVTAMAGLSMQPPNRLSERLSHEEDSSEPMDQDLDDK
ncbi:CLUMA_CG001318, isoform A [Clunio marinus]|uniref:Histone deacetylase n=1 Tax=Clunio marinus TaxID=568069 RepID=A0A1J1HHN7_9DIPT|nr:CLUMA_CG001318, isoform A [Clunio marinus]